ncbi:MAG TPA: hypothetical protein O0W81_02240, partial [Methanocorpusculum sp.]|nr:hypothetical protein [Methanocorpusculum sp.]
IAHIIQGQHLLHDRIRTHPDVIGEGARLVHELFQLAREQAPAIISTNEIEMLLVQHAKTIPSLPVLMRATEHLYKYLLNGEIQNMWQCYGNRCNQPHRHS